MSRERWDGFQNRVADWKSQVIPAHENTPDGEFTRSLEEFDELQDAVKANDGTPQAQLEIGEEATDVIIRMLGIISVVGANAGELLDKKLTLIQEKYPPSVISGQLAEGVPFHVAMAEQKRAWQQRQNGNGNGHHPRPPLSA